MRFAFLCVSMHAHTTQHTLIVEERLLNESGGTGGTSQMVGSKKTARDSPHPNNVHTLLRRQKSFKIYH
jgi:hypothetical protein